MRGEVMKICVYTLLLCALTCARFARAEQETFKVVVEPLWHSLDSDPLRIQQFGGKWILAGSITFKKRSSEAVFLDELQLAWKGEKIEQLVGSLYEKNEAGAFIPIEKYFVCDSNWKKSTQQLLLRFEHPLTLGAINTFYLVLTVPEDIEHILKNGSFYIEQAGLPLPYREYVKDHELALALHEALPSIKNPNLAKTTLDKLGNKNALLASCR